MKGTTHTSRSARKNFTPTNISTSYFSFLPSVFWKEMASKISRFVNDAAKLGRFIFSLPNRGGRKFRFQLLGFSIEYCSIPPSV